MPSTRKNYSKSSRYTRKTGGGKRLLYKGKRILRGVGLNKTEKKQVDKKIKRAIKSQHALKYMDVANYTGNEVYAPALSTVSGALKQVSGVAFSTTTNQNVSGETLNFSGASLVPLYLTRPFKESDGDDDESPNALNGQYIIPKVARVNFSIERVCYPIGHSSGTGLPDDIARTLPISIRILRVGFKTAQGSTTYPNPNLDLFLDVHGNPISINQENFTRLQARHGKINKKKWTCDYDKIITLNQNNIIAPTPYQASYSHNVTQKSGKSFYNFTTNFRLSQRKNGKLYYENPQQSGNVDTFTSGGQRQLLVILSWYDNAHELVGTGDQLKAPTEEDLQIKFRCESAFVDAQ